MLRIYDRPFGFRFLTKSTPKHFVFAYAPADTLMVCDAINVFCEGTVTFVGTTFTVVRRASEIAPTVGTNCVRR